MPTVPGFAEHAANCSGGAPFAYRACVPLREGKCSVKKTDNGEVVSAISEDNDIADPICY